jgi:ADP-heptose:LPS heptosyltransferase
MVYVVGDRLGDGLFKLPAIRALRRAFPDHDITWLAGRRSSVFAGPLKVLVEGFVDEVIDAAGIGVSVRELLHPPLDGRGFDIIIDTQRSLRATLVLRSIPHRLLISPAMNHFFSDRRPPSARPGSVRDELLSLIAAGAGKPVAAVHAPLALPDDIRARARVLLPETGGYVGFAPGAGGRRKCWPLERFIELAKRQNEAGRRPVFLLGPGEGDWRDTIRDKLPYALFPEQDAKESERGPLLGLALAERLDAGVANDAGPGHIMAAAGCPLVSLYGHTDSQKFSQPSATWCVIRARDYGSTQMQAIPLQAVVDALADLLDRRAAEISA